MLAGRILSDQSTPRCLRNSVFPRSVRAGILGPVLPRPQRPESNHIHKKMRILWITPSTKPPALAEGRVSCLDTLSPFPRNSMAYRIASINGRGEIQHQACLYLDLLAWFILILTTLEILANIEVVYKTLINNRECQILNPTSTSWTPPSPSTKASGNVYSQPPSWPSQVL